MLKEIRQIFNHYQDQTDSLTIDSDELADIFFCLVRIADYYDLDLEKAQLDARRFGLKYLGKKTDF